MYKLKVPSERICLKKSLGDGQAQILIVTYENRDILDISCLLVCLHRNPNSAHDMRQTRCADEYVKDVQVRTVIKQ